MGRELYPEIVFCDTVEPDYEEVDETVEAIHEACAGWGTDESGLVDALGVLTPEDRFKVYYRYEALKERNLVDRIDSECGERSFGKAVQLIAAPSDIAECKMIKYATEDLGTREHLLYPILLGRSNQEMDHLKKTYYKYFEDDLGQKIGGEVSGNLERLLFNALQGIEIEYDPDFHTPEKAEEDADAFYEAGQGSWGTDETELFKMLCECPPEHLEAMNEIYVEKHDVTMSKALKKEMGGTLEDACVYLVEFKLKPAETAAAMIKKACAGFGTEELALTMAIIRYQLILAEVAEKHEEMYEKTLLDRVDSETGGDYGALLCKIVESAF